MTATRDRRGTEQSRVAVAVALLYILLWSSAFIATKVGVTHSPPLTLLSVRFLCAAAILAVIARVRGLPAPQGRAAWGRLALFGLLNCALYLGFGYESLRHLSAGMGAILAATNPLMLALVAPRLLGERLTPARVLGLILGFGGVIFVMGARLGGGSTADTAMGMALQLVGVICLVGATVVYKRRPPQEHPLVINAVQLGAAGLALVLPALLAEDPIHTRVDAPLAWSFLYLVFVISIGASLLWFWLLARGEASVASAYYFLTPIFGLGLAALLLGEPFGPRDLIGLAAVAVGIALIGRPPAPAHATIRVMPLSREE
ncbi:MAG: EamA family transporter [Chloroflexota bacterium]|nr:EamA family transporter [Chloroflexota bacterium]